MLLSRSFLLGSCLSEQEKKRIEDKNYLIHWQLSGDLNES